MKGKHEHGAHISSLLRHRFQFALKWRMHAPTQLAFFDNKYTRMGSYRKWFKTIRRKLGGSSNRDIIVVYTNTSPSTHEESARYQDLNGSASSSSSSTKKFLSHEDIAAIKLQASFRGHLARQAFRALRSLVKLQALVRGACVRKQARMALHCMHALVRLQVKVRARQLLSESSNGRSVAA